MKLTNKTVREIALEMPASMRVFEELKIDYCCGGNKNFKEACEIAGISPDSVEEKISELLKDSQIEKSNDVTEEDSASNLINQIVYKHHNFTRDELERLNPLMDKVFQKHGEKHPELLELKQSFLKLRDDLIPHLQKEELILFPFIKNLENSVVNNLPAPTPPFGTVKNPIRMMGIEHDTAGELLKEIRAITDDFSTPEGACPSYKALYFGLEELEKDLHQHIHLENNILFPMAEKLEKTAS